MTLINFTIILWIIRFFPFKKTSVIFPLVLLIRNYFFIFYFKCILFEPRRYLERYSFKEKIAACAL